jgi:hypothetical protein
MIRGRVSLQAWQRRVDLLRETVTASLDLSHGSNVMDGARRNTRLQMACLPMSYPPCPATGVWRKASEKFQVDDNSSDVNVAARRLPNVGHTTPHLCSHMLSRLHGAAGNYVRSMRRPSGESRFPRCPCLSRSGLQAQSGILRSVLFDWTMVQFFDSGRFRA